MKISQLQYCFLNDFLYKHDIFNELLKSLSLEKHIRDYLGKIEIVTSIKQIALANINFLLENKHHALNNLTSLM